MTRKKRKIILILSILVFVIIASASILYSQGYTLDGSFRFSRGGGLYISAPLTNSDIFINGEKEKTTSMLSDGLFMSNLKVGEYSILVAKEDFWPWAKTLNIKEGIVTEVRAFMVPENPKGELLLNDNFSNIWISPDGKLIALQKESGYNSYLVFYSPGNSNFLTESSQFTKQLLSFRDSISNVVWEKNTLFFKSDKGIIKTVLDAQRLSASSSYVSEPPYESSDFEKISKKGDQKIWWDPNTSEIFVDWLEENSQPPYYMCPEKPCILPLQIFRSHLAIENVDFLPGRKDIIILSVGNGIYALEIDGRGDRLIYPIYKGKGPLFAVSQDKDVYIIDENSLFKISLEEVN
ncbi:hypothetical protein KKA27_00115 [Patescibacteria group bacterium]|nr:hypothetical protein [Patescibacteria group bacterium]MBU2633085.1 hypothetical protein [Patescibacteria group bacterium]